MLGLEKEVVKIVFKVGDVLLSNRRLIPSVAASFLFHWKGAENRPKIYKRFTPTLRQSDFWLDFDLIGGGES